MLAPHSTAPSLPSLHTAVIPATYFVLHPAPLPHAETLRRGRSRTFLQRLHSVHHPLLPSQRSHACDGRLHWQPTQQVVMDPGSQLLNNKRAGHCRALHSGSRHGSNSDGLRWSGGRLAACPVSKQHCSRRGTDAYSNTYLGQHVLGVTAMQIRAPALDFACTTPPRPRLILTCLHAPCPCSQRLWLRYPTPQGLVGRRPAPCQQAGGVPCLSCNVIHTPNKYGWRIMH